MLQGELSLLQSFNHPNIVKIYAYEQNKKDLYFVLEYMENGSLRKTMQQLGSIPEDLVAKYIGQALAGLAYIHQHNIIHRYALFTLPSLSTLAFSLCTLVCLCSCCRIFCPVCV
jgi:hypothetical protein